VVRGLPYFLLIVAAVVIAAELARPFRSASIAFDSQVSVLHFERLVAGQRLESLVSTTPKPLLTAIFGPLYALTHDWRSLAWATIGAYAVAVALAAALVRRLAGPVAGAFAGVALLASPGLLFDVGFALATPWAMLGWVGAGLALTARRPRYGLAGFLLAMATLARLETLVVVGAAAIAVAWGAFGPSSTAFPRPSRRAWLVPLVGALAIPTLMLHDLVLTGNPLFWATVAARYSAATRLHIMTPLEVVRFLFDRYWAAGPLLLLAVLGGLRTLLDRSWSVFVGLLALGPGIAVFLVLLAVRHIFVSDRYTAAIDIAVAFAAGIGFAGLSHELVGGLRHHRLLAEVRPSAWAAAAVGGAALVAAVLAGPNWFADPGLRATVRNSLALAVDTDRVRPILAAALAPRVLDPATAGGAAGTPLALVPTAVLPRLAVDLDLSLLQIVGADPARVDLSAGYPVPGQIVFHDRAADRAAPGWKDLETSGPRTVGRVTVEPLLADPARGVWVLRLR
jgi:hypothetical protein